MILFHSEIFMNLSTPCYWLLLLVLILY